MRATIKYVEQRFSEFNTKMFGGRLPRVRIRMSEAATFLGQCVAKRRPHPDGSIEHYDFELRISALRDLSEPELEDVIIHEMIHYFIMYHGLIDTSPHGEIFKAMMHSINRNFGRHISISHRSSAEERAQVRAEKRTWHVIATIKFRNGRHGVKVLPRVVPKVLAYHKNASASPDIVDVKLYLHDNPFFNRYPTSAALRVHEIDGALLASNLTGAHILKVENGKLIQS